MLVLLLNKEIDHLYTYYNPTNLPQKVIPNIQKYMFTSKSSVISEKQWKLYCNLFYQIDPLLALQVQERLKIKVFKNEVYIYLIYHFIILIVDSNSSIKSTPNL